MNNKLDRFLLTVLWLLAMLMVAMLWFDVIFAFDLFSASHWQRFADLQASQKPIKPLFYISLVMVAVITVTGLYHILLRPRWRRIRFDRPNQTVAQRPDEKPQSATSTETQQPVQPAPTLSATDAQPTQPVQSQPQPTVQLTRPPRLNLGASHPVNNYPAATGGTATSASRGTPQPSPQTVSETDKAQLKTIFESAGYTTKDTPRIRGMQTALFAIAPGEILWIGAVGVTIAQMNAAVGTVRRVFDDTLDGIEITINAFIVAAADSDAQSADITLFNTIDEVRDYIAQNPAAAVTDDDIGDFEAYSSYMTTVTDYIGKI